MTRPTERPLERPNVPARTRLLTVVAAYLALTGAMAIIYAGFVPIPPFSDVPAPLVGQVLGAIALVAAIGVFVSRRGAGRPGCSSSPSASGSPVFASHP